MAWRRWRVPANGAAAAARLSQWEAAARRAGSSGAGGGEAAPPQRSGSSAPPPDRAPPPRSPGPPAPHRPPHRLSMYDNLYLHGFEDSEAVSAAGAGRGERRSARAGWVSVLGAMHRGVTLCCPKDAGTGCCDSLGNYNYPSPASLAKWFSGSTEPPVPCSAASVEERSPAVCPWVFVTSRENGRARRGDGHAVPY